MSDSEAEKLAFWLGDVVAPKLRGELASARGERRDDLAESLEKLDIALAELARRPEGARLALAVMGMHLDWVRLDVEGFRAVEAGRRRGRAKGKETRKRRVQRRHAQIQRAAAALSPKLSAAARAKALARKFPKMSERTIRRMIPKAQK